MTTPILIVGDAPTAGTGLGRITADVASRIATNLSDVYRVATLGYGGIASRNLPYHHYTAEGMSGWVLPSLPEVWDDWAGRDKGVILFVSDPSRLSWFARPEMSEEIAQFPSIKNFLEKPKFSKWIYVPVDGAGPNERLTYPLSQTLLGFDRILAYGQFGEGVIRRTLGDEESDKRGLTSLPHGVDTSTFYPRNKQSSRGFFFAFTGASNIFGKKDTIHSDEVLIGAVATNQARKDMALLIESVAIVSRTRKVRLWLHTDMLERESGWSIPSLLLDFGLLDRTVISVGHIPDEAMAKAYSACDITIAPGPEGFGYPIAESLACGTPVIHGSYAGGADILPRAMTIDPVAFRHDGIWACKRPVYSPEHLATKAAEWIGGQASLDPMYSWGNNWQQWEKWFREGVRT